MHGNPPYLVGSGISRSKSAPLLQDLVCAADEDEAMRSYRRALENSLSGASAAHPYELIGEERMSLAKVCVENHDT